MMQRMRQFTAAMLMALLFWVSSAAAIVPSAGPEILRIGLSYGSEALAGANLDNNVGSGYRFGYYDDNLQFMELGSTAAGQVSVVKAQNVFFSAGNYIDDTTSGVTVGCYHLQAPTTYSDFQSASMAATQITGGFPAWVNGVYYVRIGAYLTKEAALAAQPSFAGSTVAGTSSYAITVVQTGTSTVLFQFDGGATLSLGIQPGIDNAIKAVTWFKGFRYYGGFRYQRVDGGNLTVVNVVSIEDYLKGVVPQEMSKDWPVEALKAQAVCARSYAALNLNKHEKNGFDLCNTTDCQAYKGLNVAGPISDQAVDETAGEYAVYNGQVAQTFYYSSNGGATEDVKNVWNEAIPYLRGIKDPWEATMETSIPNYRWTVTFTTAELATKLRARGYQCANIVDFYVSERSTTGNVISFTFVDSAGKKWTIANRGKELCRVMLGLKSINYTISGGSGEQVSTPDGTYYVNGGSDTLPAVSGAYAVDSSGAVAAITGTPYVVTASGVAELLPGQTAPAVPPAAGSTGSGVYTITGAGWGHSVGMSQYGAHAMAKAGKTYLEILKFYFTGIEVQS